MTLRKNHPSAARLDDELAISAMASALHILSDYDLGTQKLRAIVYLDAKIPLHRIYNDDAAAVRVECHRRKACLRAEQAQFAAALR
jgi:hypothetical protein